MKHWSTRAAVLTFSAMTLIAASANAQTWDKRTNYTFSAPVEMPGVTLEAGEYVFKLADPNGSRSVLQVTSKDEKEVFGLFFSIPIEADAASNEPELRFYETAAGTKPAVRAVWYPGERTGREFIYPREQANRLAKSVREPILTTASDSTKADETRSADLTRLDADGQAVAVNDANASASTQAATSADASRQTPSVNPAASQSRIEPTSGSTTAADRPASSIGGGTPTARNSETAAARSALPATASSIPTLLIAGVALLALAVSLRAIRTA